GQVTDATGKPLAAVRVRNMRTNQSVPTDQDGRYILPGAANDRLEFQMLGYQPLELNAGDARLVQLQVAENSLDEVVVVGYGSQKKVNLTGAVSTVKFDEATNSRPNMNLASALVGRGSGLNIAQTSGAPG